MKPDSNSQRLEKGKNNLSKVRTKRDIKVLIPLIDVNERLTIASNFAKNYKENFIRQHAFFKGKQVVEHQKTSLKSSLKKGLKV